MNKIYTSVLCMALLMPTVARAEICTDFDDNMNVIEFDCAEGVNAARKRIAAEREKVRAAAERQAEQERIAAEKAAVAKRQADEQRKIAERAERERIRLEAEKKADQERKQLRIKAQEQLEAEQNLSFTDADLKREMENLRLEQKPWYFYVGLGAGAFFGDTRKEDAFLPDDMRSIYSVDYESGGDPHFVLSAGVRRYFVDSNWYSQLELTYRTPHAQRLEWNLLDASRWNSISHTSDPDRMEISRQSIELSASVGRRLSLHWSVYGKLGFGSTSYTTKEWILNELKEDNVSSINFGFGLEYKFSNLVAVYAEGAAWVGSFPYSDSLLSGILGLRFMF